MQRRNFLWCSLLFLASCSATTQTSNSAAVQPPKKLRFAVTDANTRETLEKEYGAFRATLAEVLGVEIEFVVVENFVDAAPAMLTNQLDLTLAGGSEYLILRARAKAIPLVTFARPDYHSVLVVRADQTIKSVADLRGKTIEMGRFGLTSSHIGGIKILTDAGLNPKTDVKILNSQAYDLTALKTGKVDAWVRNPQRYQQALQSEGASEQDYPIIATSPSLPDDVFVVSSYLAPEFIETMRSNILKNQDKLIQALLSSGELKKFEKTTFASASDSNYDLIREVYKSLGQEEIIQ